MKPKQYELIIFDWDGTLIDSQAHIIGTMKQAIADCALPMPADDAVRHIIGLSLAAILELFPQLSVAEVKHVANRYRDYFFAGDEPPSTLFDGAAETIEDLHASGYYLAVATGKGRRGLDEALRSTGLGDYFHITRCADETRSKPHPMMLDEILTDLDMPAGQAVMVGDTSYDMDMAGNIDMDCVAVTYGMHDRGHLERSRPTYFIDSIQQISQYV